MINEIAMSASLEDLKKNLPIPFVMSHYGHEPSSSGSGRLHYINPFRHDTNPSFDVFRNDEGVQRWGDWAAQAQGSVIDLVVLFEEADEMSEVMSTVRRIYASFLDSDWKWPEDFNQEREHVEPEEVRRLIAEGDSNLRRYEFIGDMIESKPGLTYEALQGWRLTVRDGKLQIPYPGDVNMKYRHADGSKTSVKGGKSTLYYAEREDNKPLLLVEGESDAWAARRYAGDEYWVVAVPGVGHQPTKIGQDLLECKEAVIFFDGDEPGRKGAESWELFLNSHDISSSVVPTPKGRDICDLSEEEFWRCMGQARPTVTNLMGLENFGNGYGIVKGDTRVFLSDWVLEVHVLVETEEGRIYEGDFRQNHKVVKKGVSLTPTDLSNPNRLHKWARTHGGSFSGAPGTPAKLTNLLDSESNRCWVVSGTSRPGLVGSTFTWPGGHIGVVEVRTVPGDVVYAQPEEFMIEDVTTQEAAEILEGMLGMYSSEEILPILSWYAIAPLRTKYVQFPVLSVSGTAGAGKTAVVRHVQGAFAGVKFETNLTATTPFGVSGLMGSSNAFPLWFDEYRRGGDANAMERLNQHLRDAYTATPSTRGGMSDEYSKLGRILTDSPLVLSGESYADEQSHRDRLIKVFLDPAHRGELPQTWKSLAKHFLTFLVNGKQYEDSYLESPPEIPYMDIPGLSERQRYNIGVLVAGHRILADYAWSMGITLPKMDLESLIAGMKDETSEDSIMEVLVQVYESQYNDDNNAVVISEGKTIVHSTSVMEVARKLNLTLPFSSGRHLSEFLKRSYSAYSHTDNTGKARRTWVLNRDIRKGS